MIVRQGYSLPFGKRMPIGILSQAERLWREQFQSCMTGRFSTPLCRIFPDYEKGWFRIAYEFFTDTPPFSLGRALYPGPGLTDRGTPFLATGKFLHRNTAGTEGLNLLDLEFVPFRLDDPRAAELPVWYIDENGDGLFILASDGTLDNC